MANTQQFSDPIGISASTAGVLGLEAIDHRRGNGALSQPSTGATSGTLSGVFPGGTTGAGVSNDLQGVVSSGLTVTHNAGHYACDRGGGSLYLGMAYGAPSVTLDTGDANNPRWDLLAIRVRDPGVSGESAVTESAKIVIIKGTPAASPTKPTGSLTNGDVLLTSALVGYGANASTITSLVDERQFIVARGGITPRRTGDDRVGAYEGQYRDNLETNGLDRWNGSAWEQVASPAIWSQFTPKLYSDGGGEANLGTSGSAFGRYIVVGKILHLRMEFRAVRPCNLGYGYISSRLPAGIKSAAARESHIHGKLNTPGPSIWLGDVYIPPDSNYVWPYFPNSQSDCRLNAYRVAVTSGGSGASTPLIPGDFADPFALTIQGTIEIQ